MNTNDDGAGGGDDEDEEDMSPTFNRELNVSVLQANLQQTM